MARNSTRVCKSTGKNSSATRIRMAKVWYTVEHCWTRLDTAEQYQTRLNTSYCPDAVEHSRTLLNNWAPLNSGTLPDDVEYYWTLLDSVEHLGHGPDRIGHSRTLWHNWAPLDSGWTVPNTSGHSFGYGWTLTGTAGHRMDSARHCRMERHCWILNSLWSRLFGKFWDNETLRNGNKLAPLLDTVGRHG